MKTNAFFDLTDSEPSSFSSFVKIKNEGFSKLKNSILRCELERCSKVPYSSEKHRKIEDLGYKTLHQIDILAKNRWVEYFNSGGQIYIQTETEKLPLSARIIFDKSIINYIGKGIPKPKKVKPIRRGWIKGGKGGKVYGFDFRIQTNDRLSKKNRIRLILESERFINVIVEEQSKLGNENIDKCAIHLDPSNSDFELLSQWNEFYMKYGYRFVEFEEKWFKQFIKENGNLEVETLNSTELEEFNQKKLSFKLFSKKYNRADELG